MSSKKGMPANHTAHPNVTPLIDIVMCLIIFFMLVAKIGVNTGAETMDLPATILGSNIQDMGNTLTLNVYRGPGDSPDPLVTALVQGAKEQLKLTESRGQEIVNPLRDALKFYRYGQDLKQGGKGLNADNEDFKVIIRGESGMGYRFLEPVLITCAEAGVMKVNFATEQISETATVGG